jgi:hypothetical protein
MIYITGDTHGDMDIKKLNTKNFPEGKELTKEDYVIILGDFGFLWKLQEDRNEKYWKNWLNEKPWTTLFLDGNHENHDRLNDLDVIDKFGGKVGHVTDSIYHLKRGELYSIDNKSILTIGGATSVDKKYRKEHISWWSGETLNYQENNKVVDLFGTEVDIILTHTGPQQFVTEFNKSLNRWFEPKCSVSDLLDSLYDNIKFKSWYAGHMHPDGFWTSENDNRFTFIYNDIFNIS